MHSGDTCALAESPAWTMESYQHRAPPLGGRLECSKDLDIQNAAT